MFNQVFEYPDLAVVGFLIVLEGILSIDNALVLGLLAKRVRPEQRSRVLTYGLIGAFVIRMVAISFAQFLLNWRIVKLLGGAYLTFVAASYFYGQLTGKSDEKISLDPEGEPTLVRGETGEALSPQRLDAEIETRTIIPIPDRDEAAASGADPDSAAAARSGPDSQPVPAGVFANFWKTIVVVELTDLAFAVDSILAGIALVGAPPEGHVGIHPKLWVVVLGGMLGVILMRFAAMAFIRLLERFPRFELSAYLLVLVIGTKLCAEWIFNGAGHEHRLDFHDYTHPAFAIFWILMLVSFLIGFVQPKPERTPDES
jgi:YkoY family integral membrane protein